MYLNDFRVLDQANFHEESFEVTDIAVLATRSLDRCYLELPMSVEVRFP